MLMTRRRDPRVAELAGERQPAVDGSGRLDAGHVPHGVAHAQHVWLALVQHLRHLAGLPPHADVQRQHVRVVEPGRHLDQLREAPGEQPSFDEENPAERDLHDDQRVPEPVRARAGGGRAAAAPHRAREIGPRPPERGQQTEADAGQDGRGRRRPEDAQVDADGRRAREPGGKPGHEAAHDQPGEQHAQRGAADRQHGEFGRHGPREGQARRAQRRPDGEFGPAHGGPGHHQVRHVRARDRHHEQHGGEQHHHPRPDGPDQMVVQPHDLRAHPGSPAGIPRVEGGQDGAHPILRLGDGHPWLQTLGRSRGGWSCGCRPARGLRRGRPAECTREGAPLERGGPQHGKELGRDANGPHLLRVTGGIARP